MSRLDYFTIAIVAVCIIALIFLIYKTTDLLKKKDNTTADKIENTLEEMGIEDDETDTYTYDDEGEIVTDDAAITGEATTSDDAEDINYVDEEELLEEAPEEEVTATPTSYDNTSARGSFLVLAGAFQYKANAEKLASKLKNLGYPDAEVTLFNRGKYAGVIVERFENVSNARSAVSKLKNNGIDAYVHKKREEN